MHFLFMPDSFKGSLSATQICQILQDCAQRIFPDAVCSRIPIADGGEGTVDCFLQVSGGVRVKVRAAGPLMEPQESFYGLIHDGRTAVIEMAACAGLPLAEGHKDPARATTYGVGELISAALSQNLKGREADHIILGLGGSATTDGGCGMAAALGVRFYNAAGETFVPTGGTLKDIARIDASAIDPRFKQVRITAMCDIDNPLYGPDGAAYVFGPQKGADPALVKELDAGLQHLAAVILRDLKLDVSQVPGAGAAGGMGAGCLAFLGAQLQSGIDTVLEAADFEHAAELADYIITGEGRIDGQSLQGKAVIGIARRAQAFGKPVIALVGGAVDSELAPAWEQGLTAVFTINRLPQDLALSKAHSAENLAAAAENLFRLIKAAQK